MLGMAQAMAMGPLQPEQRERLDVLLESGEALLVLLNDLLDTSKIEAGRLDLVAEPFDLHKVLNRVEQTFAPAAAAKGVKLTTFIDPAAAPVWVGDGVRLGQICTNLVSNAVKFTHAGRVEILVDQPEDGGLRIAVRDTGMGMSAETVEGLFRPFGQADAKISHRFGGTGLGLTISRSLARLMSGDLIVESRRGKGSAFTLTLPLAPAGAMRPEIATPEPDEVSLSSLRILAADDNAVNRQVLQAVLDSLGIDSTIVDGGAAAVDAFRCGAFDAVILDLRMPDCDGLQAAAMMRRNKESLGVVPTPIVLLSGDVSDEVRREGRLHGIEHFVAKPLEISVLIDVLSKIELHAVGVIPNPETTVQDGALRF
ncbi:MAG: ATP-binding protein [Brevundimonas sp.]|nr:ATP-binding protein [Brevundimonas sp.]